MYFSLLFLPASPQRRRQRDGEHACRRYRFWRDQPADSGVPSQAESTTSVMPLAWRGQDLGTLEPLGGNRLWAAGGSWL